MINSKQLTSAILMAAAMLCCTIFCSGVANADNSLPVSTALQAERAQNAAAVPDLGDSFFSGLSNAPYINPADAKLLESGMVAPPSLVDEVVALPEPPTLACLVAVVILMSFAMWLRRKFDSGVIIVENV